MAVSDLQLKLRVELRQAECATVYPDSRFSLWAALQAAEAYGLRWKRRDYAFYVCYFAISRELMDDQIIIHPDWFSDRKLRYLNTGPNRTNVLPQHNSRVLFLNMLNLENWRSTSWHRYSIRRNWLALGDHFWNYISRPLSWNDSINNDHLF